MTPMRNKNMQLLGIKNEFAFRPFSQENNFLQP